MSLNISKNRIKEAEETGADYLVGIYLLCYRNSSDIIDPLNSNIKMINLKILNSLF
ncbi:MAG: hypothetical protein ACFFDX_15790 [Candidatus Odinarchaeota archaeon]